MNTIKLKYSFTKEEDKGYSVRCLDWHGIISQGETISECKSNMISVTKMFIQLINDGTANKQYYKKPNHNNDLSNNEFFLFFDIKTGKNIPSKKLYSQIAGKK